MKVFNVGYRSGGQLLTEQSAAVVLSHDGKHAHMIIEQDTTLLIAYIPDDPEFAEKARAYGFQVPSVRTVS